MSNTSSQNSDEEYINEFYTNNKNRMQQNLKTKSRKQKASMAYTSNQNTDDEDVNELYDNQKNNKRQIQNLKKITKSKKQKVPMLYTNNQNTDDEDTNELCANQKNEKSQMQNFKKVGAIRKVTPKKPKFQAYLSELEKEYHGISNEDCIRINKTEGGKFCIKIPTSKTGSDYLVVTKYKTTDMDKVEQKDRWKTSTFTAKTFVDEKVKIDNAILVAFNHLQDLLMEKFMTNDNKKIESYNK
ncbi:hypothetical protein AGLY_015138 [Aphis glycines]|uniref:Uncharacterized protein n=1 Tax=Aphis glycines TaxID=307491 RepID=A0A6G0T3D6_APHGL|nr:hypothetical protein AGLY_015138 [Aphis glycines]